MTQAVSAPVDAAAVKCELAGEVLRSFGSLRFAATGWSMLPTIWPGDTLVVERAGGDQVRVGEVVLVGRDGRLCAHRIVSRAKDSGNLHGIPYLITQGDAMPAPDRPVMESELLGRVSYLMRAGKRIAVPAELSVAARLTAKIVRRSFLAARGLVYLNRVYLNRVYLNRVYLRRMVPISGKSGPKELVSPCRG
jgi:hypothetical protein